MHAQLLRQPPKPHLTLRCSMDSVAESALHSRGSKPSREGRLEVKDTEAGRAGLPWAGGQLLLGKLLRRVRCRRRTQQTAAAATSPAAVQAGMG